MSGRKRKVRNCVDCGKECIAWKFSKPINATRCRSCAAKRGHREQRGETNPNWKGGQVIGAGGYVYLHRPDHLITSYRGYVKRANLVWEEATGHYPDWSKRELLHHIDGNKLNDDIENLRLMSHSEHMSLHGKQQDNGFGVGVNHYNYKHGKYIGRREKLNDKS